MIVIVSVVNLTALGWVISQSTGLKLATESVVHANEAMATAQCDQKRVDFFQTVDYKFRKLRYYAPVFILMKYAIHKCMEHVSNCVIG